MPPSSSQRKLPATPSHSTALKTSPSSHVGAGSLKIRPLRILTVPPAQNRNHENDSYRFQDIFQENVLPATAYNNTNASSSSSTTDNNDSNMTLTFAVAGQKRSTQKLLPWKTAKNAADVDDDDSTMIIGAPLSHLYSTHIHIQLEYQHDDNSDKRVYRGSYAVHELPIHRSATMTIPLQNAKAASRPQMVLSTTSNTTTRTTTTTSNNDDNNHNNNCLYLQVEFVLEGPCRTEVVKAHQAFNAWLVLVDRVEDVVREVWHKVAPQIPDAAKKKEALLLIVPVLMGLMLPLITICVCVSPIVIGFCILFFPIMIPLVLGLCLLVLASLLGTTLVISLVSASTRQGRQALAKWWNQQSTLQSYFDILRGPRFGLQSFYYATGPRPTPVSLVRTQMPKDKWNRLALSLTIDGVGSFSYILPFVGEAFDIVWAPSQVRTRIEIKACVFVSNCGELFLTLPFILGHRLS